MVEIDILTGLPHSPPSGMEHHNMRKNGKFYASCKIAHFIIKEHQDAFPELAQQMKNNPNATNVYSAFLAMLPLQIKGRLTPSRKKDILKSFKLI